jgi:hypothetical protein
MKKTLPVALIIAAALVMMSFTPAHARWGEGRRDGKGMRMNKMDKEQLKERIELIKMWKIVEVLDLDQETAAKLFPVMHEYDEKQCELGEARGATIDQIKDELGKETADPAALSSLINQFKQNERDMTELRIKRLDALSKILSDEDIAKMIMLGHKFEHRMRGLFSEAKYRHRDRGRWMRDSDDRPRASKPGPKFE